MPQPSEPDTLNGRRPNDEHDPLIGTLLDERYQIEERIATGGFGAVYRARTASGELVALKILHPRLTRDPNMVARFQREGATMIQLHDPHTVATHAVGQTGDGTLYIAMELLSGESLQDRLRRVGALPWRSAVPIARAVCSSLAEAHALGIVHRDLKPANIHVEARGADHDFVKVIDFGIVKIAPGSSVDDGQELTFAGHMIGTYDYMSPEQIVGSPCHDRSDIYSLGVVLYEMLTGRRPFPKVTSPASMMTALLTQTPIAPAVLAAIPPELDRLVMRCLEREAEDRFGSIVELAQALDATLAPRAAHQEEITVAQPPRTPAPPEPDVATYREVPGREEPGREEPSATNADDERTWIDPARPVTLSSGSITAQPSVPLTPQPSGSVTAQSSGPATPQPPGPITPQLSALVAPQPPDPVKPQPSGPLKPPSAEPASPQVSLATTLQGVAVAPELRRRSPPPADRAPFEWPPVPRATSWNPPTTPHEPTATGLTRTSDPPPPARSYAVLWLALALALAGIAAMMLTALL